MKPLHAFVWLASQSSRRRELLSQIGVETRLCLPDDTEDAEALEAVLPGELPADYVQRVTRAKLNAARQRWARRGLPAAPILCADTTVALGRRILGKPADAEEATQVLTALAGHTHRVLTAVAVWPSSHPSTGPSTGRKASRALCALSISRVRFAPIPPAVIQAYVASGEPFGKAGSYAIQGSIAGWIEHIEGSHSGIMGLPLFETAQLLRRAGVQLPI